MTYSEQNPGGGLAHETPNLASIASLATHEIRNPLASVKMVIQTLARAPLDDERARKRLAIAVREIRTMERMLTALAELGRPYSSLKRVCCKPATLAGEAVNLCRAEIEERGCVLRLKIASQLPMLEVDAERVALALAFLITQTAHSARDLPITLEVNLTPDHVCFVIKSPSVCALKNSHAALCTAMIEKIAKEHGGGLCQGRSETAVIHTLFLPWASGRSVK